MAANVSCTHCSAPLDFKAFFHRFADCPNCGSSLRVHIFPAFFREERPGDFGDPVTVAGENTCFYHAEKKAVTVCEGCGRFLCSLCEVEIEGARLCPGCLEAGRGVAQEKVETSRYLHGEISLFLAVVGAFLSFAAIPLGLYAAYLAVRHWNKPGKFGGHDKVKKTLGIVIGGGAALSWAIFLGFVFLAGVE